MADHYRVRILNFPTREITEQCRREKSPESARAGLAEELLDPCFEWSTDEIYDLINLLIPYAYSPDSCYFTTRAISVDICKEDHYGL